MTVESYVRDAPASLRSFGKHSAEEGFLSEARPRGRQLYERNIRLFVFACLAAGLLMLAGDLAFGVPKDVVSELIMILFLTLCLFATRAPSMAPAVALTLPLLILAGISVSFCFGIGIHDPSAPGYFVVILLGAFFWGTRGVLIFTVLSALAAALVVTAELVGLYSTPYPSTAGTIVTFDVIVLVGGALLFLIMRSFDGALTAADRARAELVELNRDLERRVAERGAELEKARDGLILSEKMAALGQLMAGIAHEINSPLAAILSSSNLSAQKLPEVALTLVQLALECGPGRAGELKALIEASAVSQGGSIVTSAEERTAQNAVAARLEELGMAAEFVGEASALLAQCGAPQLTEAAAPFIRAGTGLPAIRAAEAVASLANGLANIQSSVDRASRIVFALRSYAQVRQEEPFRHLSLEDSIEQAVSLFAGSFRHGVELTRDYGFSGTVLQRQGTLTQVWVNLIQNALQAMQNRGILAIATAGEGKQAVVRIMDDGPGVPPGVAGRIFEPFFSTKRPGEGTGLGLDISRRIVEMHGGTIDFTSVPGRTVFEVRLPLTDAGDGGGAAPGNPG